MKNIIILGHSLHNKDGVSVLTQQIKRYENKYNFKLYSSNKRFNFNLINNLKSPFYFYKKKLSIINDLFSILLTTRKKPHVIFCLSEFYTPLAYILSKIFKSKIFIACYGTYALRMPKIDNDYKKMFNRAILLCSSKYTKNILINNNIGKKLIFLNLFTDKNLFYYKKVKKERQFIFCGGSNFYKRRKGFEQLLNLLKFKEFRDLNLKLIIVGKLNDQDHENYIFEGKIIKVNIKNIKELIHKIYGNNFEIIGPITNNELRKRYSESFFNIMLSKKTHDEFDGYGLTHLEANACGTYSIGSIESGSEDAIVYGRSFIPEDLSEITKYIKEIEKNPYLKINENEIRDVNIYLKELLSIFNKN